MQDRVYILGTMLVIISFLGFVLENIWLSFRKGYIDNRNMTLPFLFGYGLFIIGYYEVAGTPDTFELTFLGGVFNNKYVKKAVYFVLTFLIVSTGEILLGFFTEKFFGFYYWNYEQLPLHFTRYTSVPTSLGFTVIIMCFMDYAFMPVYNFIKRISIRFLKPFSVIMMVMLVMDFIKSFNIMHKRHQPNIRWRVNTKKFRRLKSGTA